MSTNIKDGNNTMPSAEQVGQINALLTAIEPSIKAIAGTIIRGLMVSFPGVPPYAVLTMFSFQTANIIGQALSGDIAMMMQIRKGYREAFEEGLRKAPIVGPAANQGAPPNNIRG